jgi:hypothetical protein
VEHDLLDEIKVFLAHDALLEIIDWTQKETPQKPCPCGDLENRGESLPRLLSF